MFLFCYRNLANERKYIIKYEKPNVGTLDRKLGKQIFFRVNRRFSIPSSFHLNPALNYEVYFIRFATCCAWNVKLRFSLQFHSDIEHQAIFDCVSIMHTVRFTISIHSRMILFATAVGYYCWFEETAIESFDIDSPVSKYWNSLNFTLYCISGRDQPPL